MAKLSASERNRLPDSAFAYVDATGHRRLPIHDEAHVRNALARFERVAFEDDAARERARKRLLNAAKRFGIVPVGFITGQLRTERVKAAAAIDVSTLPTGLVTFLLADIEGSTAILHRLGDDYGTLLEDVRSIIRRAVLAAGGREVDARADEFFGVFELAPSAASAAVELQRAMSAHVWPANLECRVRVGLHTGRPTLTRTGYIGLSVHTAARVCWAANGGQIVVSEETRAALDGVALPGVTIRDLGKHRMSGLPRPVPLFQLDAEGLECDFPPLRRAPRGS